MRPSWILVCVVLAAGQVASNPSLAEGESRSISSGVELRLPDRSRGLPPPILAVASYPADDSELLADNEFEDEAGWRGASEDNTVVPSELRSGGNSLRVASNVVRKLPATRLVPGRSYRLTFTARLLAEGDARVGVKFREPKNGTFRTFQQRVSRGTFRRYEIDFTAPVFTALAELAIDVRGAVLVLDAIALRLQAALPRTEPVASWSRSFVPDGYGLVFNDEFNGSELDRHKWFTRYIYSSESLDRLNKENQRYADNGNARLAGGALHLTAKRLKLSQTSGINYESGMIRSDFTLRYGFFEARVKMPGGLGVWAAFWLNSDVSETGRLSWPPEIDIFEFVNNGKDDKVNKIHASTSAHPGKPNQFLYVHERFKAQFKDYFAPFNFNEGWHTIGAEWTAADVTFYVDGLKVATNTFQWKYTDGTEAGPAHVLLNLAIGGSWAGRYGIDESAFPQALAVDWVRVYQRPSP
jgi:beta-glucanase (GH16 family)